MQIIILMDAQLNIKLRLVGSVYPCLSIILILCNQTLVCGGYIGLIHHCLQEVDSPRGTKR